MMRFLVPIFVLLLTAACGFTPQGDIVRAAVAEKGAQAMDEGLVNAEWFICNAVSVGAVKRRYGKSRELADAYNALCDVDPAAAVIDAAG